MAEKQLYEVRAYMDTTKLGPTHIEETTVYVTARTIPQAHNKLIKRLGDDLVMIVSVNLLASTDVELQKTGVYRLVP